MNASGHDLKALQVRRIKLEAELKQVRQEISRTSRRENEIKQTIDTIEKQIKHLTTVRPTVSEHALIRYVERVLDVDMEDLSTRILSPETLATIKAIGSGRIPYGDHYELIVKNNVVVSIYDKDFHKGK